MELFS